MSKTTPKKVETAFKQIYEAQRSGMMYQVLYADDQIVLLRSDDSSRNNQNGHRIERRSHFEAQRESDWFNLKADSDLDMTDFDTVEWSDVDYIGAKTEQNLHDAGIETVLDVRQADDDTLLGINGLGNAGLENLRDFAQ